MGSRSKGKESSREILCKARTGEELTREDAIALAGVEGEELLLLLKTARDLADRHKGRIISYSRKVFIPLTNFCRNACGYCIFRKDPRDPQARYMLPEEVLQLASLGASRGCKEALFCLGDKPELAIPEARENLRRLGFESTMDYLVAMCNMVLENTSLLPHSNPGSMEEADVQRLREVNVSLGLMLENSSPRLRRAGGPHEKSPDKVPTYRFRALEVAGRLKVPFTTGILIGIGETWAERIDSLFVLRALQKRYGHIQEVIVQNFRAKPMIPMRNWPMPTTEDHMRTLAVARLVLGGDMNIQAPPNLAPGIFESLISTGVNDWGGVSPVTQDFINPEAPWPHLDELHERTISYGYVLRERLAVYPTYVTSRQVYLHRALWPKVERVCGPDGYAKVDPNERPIGHTQGWKSKGRGEPDQIA